MIGTLYTSGSTLDLSAQASCAVKACKHELWLYSRLDSLTSCVQEYYAAGVNHDIVQQFLRLQFNSCHTASCPTLSLVVGHSSVNQRAKRANKKLCWPLRMHACAGDQKIAIS